MKVLKWQVPVPRSNVALVGMVDGSEPISVGVQDSDVVVWATAPPSPKGMSRRKLIVAPTGEEVEVPGDARFLGTVTMGEHVRIVLHLWDAGWE